MLSSRCNEYKKGKNIYITCDCECGNTIELRKNNFGKTKSCGCIRKKSGPRHYAWQGCGEISKNVWTIIQRNATERGLEFSITIEYAWKLFQSQNRKCALTGLELNFNDSFRTQSSKIASLDRIDSSVGYIEGNVQWIHKVINYVKSNMDNEMFIAMCQLVSKKQTEDLSDLFLIKLPTYTKCKVKFG